VLAVLLHVLFGVVIWFEMQWPPARAVVATGPEQAMEIRFIAVAPPAPAAPDIPPPPASPPPRPSTPALAPTRVPPRKPEPAAKDAMTMQVPAAPPVHLFDNNGQPQLPPAAATAPAPVPGYVQRTPQGDTRIMRHDNPIKYQATRFDDGWGKGNAVDQTLQKLVDKTTLKKTIRLPGGIRVHCAVFLLFAGCGGEPPPPPSAKDGDERLSMAPAKPLAADPHPPKPPSVEACIAMYRAGKPLEWGCPIDTPRRAVDDELRERERQRSHPR
jgi:hypothetical protein